MAYVGALLIAAANCVVVYFLSMLAVGGDGSGDGVRTVRLFGFAWIAVISFASLVLCARSKGATALLTAASALPTGFLAAMALNVASTLYESKRANTPEFEASCKTAGATYVAAPATPVHSIAYDWEGKYPPQINFFAIGSNGNVDNLRGGIGLSPYPVAIKFTEGRCCQYEGRPTNGIGPYIRRPNGGEYFGVPELTADALVMYRSSPVGEHSPESDLTQVEVTVVDRRDGRTLALLRYFLDSRKRRGCGSTAEGVMDERAFVLKAIASQ